MSVADVCELGAILKCEADEKIGLGKKIKELDAIAKTVEKKFDLESEEGAKYDRAQQKLLEQAQNEGSRFEVISLNLSHFKKECDIVTEALNDFLTRVHRYLLAKKEVEADQIIIENELVRMEEKMRVRETSCVDDETVRSLQKIEQILADKKGTLHNLQQFDMAVLEEQASAKQTKHDGFLQDTTSMIAFDFEQKRTEMENKTEQFETQAAVERKETEDALSTQKNLSAHLSVKTASLQANLAESKGKLIAANVDGESSASAIADACQRQDELREKTIQLQETISRVQGVLVVAKGKLNETRDLEKTYRKEEDFSIKEQSRVDAADARDQGSSSSAMMDTTALTKSRDTLRETVDALDQETATLSPLVADDDNSDITDAKLDEVIKMKTNFGDRLDKARAETKEQTHEKSELEVEKDAKTALLNTALKEKEELEVTNAQLSSEVETMQGRVQEIVAQIASTTSTSLSASSPSIATTESPVLVEQIQDVERQKEQLTASLTKAEEHRTVPDNGALAALQEMDALRAHRAQADFLTQHQKELTSVETGVKNADRAFQTKIKTLESELKANQAGLAEAGKATEQEVAAVKDDLGVIASDIRGLGGEEELTTLEQSGAFEQQHQHQHQQCGFEEEEKQSMSQSASLAATVVPLHRSRSGGGAVRGTPPEDSWATSAGATLDGTFASGLDDVDEPKHVEDYKNNESLQLLEAQQLYHATRGGGARGRDMKARNTQSAHSQHNDGQPIEMVDDGAVAKVGVGKPSQQKQGPVRRRHRQT